MNIQIIENSKSEGLLAKASHGVVSAIESAWATGRDAHIVVTGGRTGLAIVAAIDGALAPLLGNSDNKLLHIWFSDERFKELDSPDRNDTALIAGFAAIQEICHFHRLLVPSEGSLADAAADYAAQLDSALGDTGFDAVVLSMGEDGHVASCFPGQEEILAATASAAAVTNSPKPPAERVTITLTRLAQTPVAFIFALGTGKSEALHETLRRGASMPIELLRQNSSVGQITILTDFQVAQ
jgi:6-phosphogluconolactonase